MCFKVFLEKLFEPGKLGNFVVLTSLLLPVLFIPAFVKETGATSVSQTGLPLPRFVSLKSTRVNMRVGPGREYKVTWMYLKQGLPMEVIQEYENWRKVRDPEGNEGWILHSLLSGKRMAIIAPWEKGSRFAMHSQANQKSAKIADVEARVLANVNGCEENWCLVEADDIEGYVHKNTLWGVYPDEIIEQ